MFAIKTTLDRSRAYGAVAGALDAGLPLAAALRLLEPSKPGTIEGLLSAAARDLERGARLGEALRGRSKRGEIPREELRLIEVGEEAGTLPDLLRRMAARLEERVTNRRTVVTGLIYPVILLHMAIVAAAAPLIVSGIQPFLSSVVPKFVVLWALGLAVTIGFEFAVDRRGGSRWLADWASRLPVVGKVVKARAVSEYAYCFGVALSAGLAMPESVRLGGDASHWSPAVEASRRIAAAIGGGATLAQAHRREGVMPKEVIEALQVGEPSGTLDRTLDGASRMLGDRASRRASAIAKATPVVIYLLVAIYVAIVVISAFTGMLKLPGGI